MGLTMKKIVLILFIILFIGGNAMAIERLTTPKQRAKITQEKQNKTDLLQKIEDLEKIIILLEKRIEKLEGKKI